MLLITGGMGHVGYATVKLAVKLGFTILAQYHKTFRKLDADKISGDVKWIKCDLTDPSAVSDMCSRFPIEGVIHTAAIPNDHLGVSQPRQTFMVNSTANVNLLEHARLKRWRRFIYTSTGSVHQSWFDVETPIPESSVPEPHSLYGVTKRCGEMMVDTYSQTYNLSAASIRLSWVYGPPLVPKVFDGPRGPIPYFLKNLVDGEGVSETSGAEFAASFTFIEDCAAGLLAAYGSDTLAHTVYHLGSGRNYTTKQVSEVISRVFPDGLVEVGPGTEPWTSFTVMRGPLECIRMKEEFGFETSYSLEKGITEFADWMRSNASDFCGKSAP